MRRAIVRPLVLIACAAPGAAWAQFAPGRVEAGNFPAPFLRALAAAPVIEEVPNGAPRWLAFIDNHAAQGSTMRRGAVTAAQRAAWDAQVRDVLAWLRASPAMSRPLGLTFGASSSMELVRAEHFGPGGARTAPLMGAVLVGSFPPSDIVTGADGRPRTARGAHTSHFMIVLNGIPSIMPGPWMRDSAGNFFPLALDGRLDGLPMHGWSLVLTRGDRSPYAPVSWERAIAAFLASHLRDSDSAAEARALLERLGPAGRKAQAWVCGERPRWSLEHCFVPAGTPGAVPLVTIDPAFFDPALPRTALQVVSIVALDRIAKGSEQATPNTPSAFNLALFQSVDWRAFRDRFVR